MSCYRQALEIPLDTRVSLGARLNLAARLMEQGELEEAISLTQTATQRAPGSGPRLVQPGADATAQR